MYRENLFSTWIKARAMPPKRLLPFRPALARFVAIATIWFGLGPIAPASTIPFVPPGATVLLLSGLPGDVESENDYRDHLESWIKIVQGNPQAHRLIVLADNPESVSLTKSVQAQVMKASRDNFKGIGQTLGGTTNSLVVIAWGHGGRQGDTPVFHVRGPRIAPADFKELAESAKGADSEWILLFRGSGAFARPLAGPRRYILSSECGTVFGSDPAGMPLLLKLARSNLSGSFQSFSQEFGRATAAWYAERHLARTEEPTLWLPEGKPQLLAAKGETQAEPDGAQKSSAAAQTPNTKHQTPSSTQTSNFKLQTSEKLQASDSNAQENLAQNHALPARGLSPSADKGRAAETNQGGANLDSSPGSRSAALDFPARVQASDYPDAIGVVLRRRLAYTLGSNPAITSEQDEYIQILSQEGKHLGDFDVAYAAPLEDIAFLDCEVLHPDGKIERLDPDAIREAREPAVADYLNGQRKFFSLPGVTAGAVLHVRYRTTWKQFPLPHISLEIPIDQSLPALDCTIEIRVPREAPLRYAFENIQTSDPTVEQTTYGTRYAWRFQHLSERHHEVLSSPRHDARLLLSTFPDWTTFAEWYQRISKLADEITPEISAKAAELTRGVAGDRAKVLAIYDFVAGLRYVAIPLGINSFRPHAATRVLENQFGDCKDKANLFNTLLRAVNIQADLTLVPRFRQARDDLPGLAFNHAISRVTLSGQTLWVDTTDEVCRFGMLPPGDPGRRVLVVGHRTLEQMGGPSVARNGAPASSPAPLSPTGRDHGREGLVQLPVPDAKDHVFKLHGQVNCSSPGAALPMNLEATATGFPDYELRVAARGAKEQSASVPLLAVRFRPSSGTFALEEQHATSASALDEDFRWEAEGYCIGTCWSANGQWVLHTPFWMPKQWDQALNHRTNPLFLNEGFPLTLEEDFEFALPPGAHVEALPATAESTNPPFRWRVEWKKSDSLRLSAHFHAELARGELSESDTRLFQQALRELLGAMAGSATISR